MFKSTLLIILMIVAGLPSTSSSAAVIDVVNGNDRLADAYARLIQAEHRLLKSELVVEATKSTRLEGLLSDGHASWLENRQQKLVVDILKAKLTAYEQFKSQAISQLAGSKLELETNFSLMKIGSDETRLTAIQELRDELEKLRQAEKKLATGVETLPLNDPWAEGYRLRHVLTSRQADVVAAEILLLEIMKSSASWTGEKKKFVSTAASTPALASAWKRPAKDSHIMQLMITQAELQIQLSQHHLLNETQRLANLQELVDRGMATEKSAADLKNKVDVISELLLEQQNNLSWLRKDLDSSPDDDRVVISNQVPTPGVGNVSFDRTSLPKTELSLLPALLNHFELGQSNYLRSEAVLKGDFYREVLYKLEQAASIQKEQATSNSSATGFSAVLARGQQRELEQYRWKLKKTELQRDLAIAQIELLKDSVGADSNISKMLVSTRIGTSFPVTLPSRFISSDPFGLQTTYSAFVHSSPRFRARRPALAVRGDYSSVFRPVINRNALSYYGGFGASRFGSSFGSFNNRVHSFGLLNAGPRTFRPPGQSPFYFPGSPQTFNFNRFNSSTRFNTYRSNQIYHSSGPGHYGR